MISHLKIIDQFFTWDSNNFDNSNANSLKNCDEAVEAIRNFNWNCTLQFFCIRSVKKNSNERFPIWKSSINFSLEIQTILTISMPIPLKIVMKLLKPFEISTEIAHCNFFCIKSVKNCSQIAKSTLKTVDEFEKMKFNRRLHRCSQKLQSNCCNDKTSGFQSSGWWLSFAIWALDSV